jgi:hypothetical protein
MRQTFGSASARRPASPSQHRCQFSCRRVAPERCASGSSSWNRLCPSSAGRRRSPRSGRFRPTQSAATATSVKGSAPAEGQTHHASSRRPLRNSRSASDARYAESIRAAASRADCFRSASRRMATSKVDCSAFASRSMSVLSSSAQHPIWGLALAAVARRGVAVIEMKSIGDRQRHAAIRMQADLYDGSIDHLDRTKLSIGELAMRKAGAEVGIRHVRRLGLAFGNGPWPRLPQEHRSWRRRASPRRAHRSRLYSGSLPNDSSWRRRFGGRRRSQCLPPRPGGWNRGGRSQRALDGDRRASSQL